MRLYDVFPSYYATILVLVSCLSSVTAIAQSGEKFTDSTILPCGVTADFLYDQMDKYTGVLISTGNQKENDKRAKKSCEAHTKKISETYAKANKVLDELTCPALLCPIMDFGSNGKITIWAYALERFEHESWDAYISRFRAAWRRAIKNDGCGKTKAEHGACWTAILNGDFMLYNCSADWSINYVVSCGGGFSAYEYADAASSQAY
ncbi:hypothetical protein OAO01_09485 [Oligoflexia bacterium]|nr:hypothetical protein [Oligoflexia bacterium]